jgi:polysaccharide export outer membrane protein
MDAVKRRVAWIAFIAGLCAATATTAQDAVVPASPPPAADSGVTSGDYQIGPLDTLNVYVIGFPEYSATLPVRPDGKITTPMVEDMVAAGKTPTQLARDIEGVLAEFIRTPRVTISVEEFVGVVGAQISVLGQVVRPGQVPYRNGMRLLDVMLEVGGMTEFASGRRATLSRTVDGESVEIRIRLDRLLEKGDRAENVALNPGDVIVVPQAVF